MNSHFLKGSKLYFSKGSKVETLEDVLAGPETEVMDGIQVTQKRWSSDFPPRIFTIFLCRPVLTATTCEPPQALNESRNGLFCQQTFQSQVSKKKFKHALAVSMSYLHTSKVVRWARHWRWSGTWWCRSTRRTSTSCTPPSTFVIVVKMVELTKWRKMPSESDET